jgi:hypothetical protein
MIRVIFIMTVPPPVWAALPSVVRGDKHGPARKGISPVIGPGSRQGTVDRMSWSTSIEHTNEIYSWPEPPWGIEPQTYALREARGSALGPPPAQIAAQGPRNAPSEQHAPDSGPRPGPRPCPPSSNRVLVEGGDGANPRLLASRPVHAMTPQVPGRAVPPGAGSRCVDHPIKPVAPHRFARCGNRGRHAGYLDLLRTAVVGGDCQH